jgi:hypothetical protein
LIDLIGFDTVTITEPGNAHLTCEVTGATTGMALVGAGAIGNLKPAGVSVLYIYSNQDADDTFVFSSDYWSVPYDESRGFSSYYSSPLRGGYLSGVIS